MHPHALPGMDVVVDGVRLHVVDYGDGAGLPIVLLSGPFTPRCFWDDVARNLAHDHRVVVPDLVGLGESEAPTRSGPYAMGAQAGRVRGVLNKLGIERFAVVGHDVGGVVAVHLAAHAPDRVQGLALIGTPLHSQLAPTRAAHQAAHRVADGIRRGARRDTSHDTSADRSRGRRRFIRAIDVPAAERLLDVIAGVPALVLWGEQDDVLSTEYGKRVATALDAAWVPLSDAGHLAPRDRPERVAEELHAFVGAARHALP
jgi:pimeloyl-ACP methyl ester carboxylesterase